MGEFDLIHVGLKGIGDDGLHKCEVRLGFFDQQAKERSEVIAELYLPLDLGVSLEELREQVRVAALSHFQEAVRLLGQHTTGDLHQAAQDASARQQEALRDEAEATIAEALRFDP